LQRGNWSIQFAFKARLKLLISSAINIINTLWNTGKCMSHAGVLKQQKQFSCLSISLHAENH